MPIIPAIRAWAYHTEWQAFGAVWVCLGRAHIAFGLVLGVEEADPPATMPSSQIERVTKVVGMGSDWAYHHE